MSSFGPASLVIYKVFSSWNNSSIEFSSTQHPNLGILIGTYSFTMLGFLAAALAILLSLTSRPLFKRFKNDGSLNIFLTVYATSIITLSANFICSLFLLSESFSKTFIYAVAAFTINSIIQISFITLTTINFCKKAFP